MASRPESSSSSGSLDKKGAPIFEQTHREIDSDTSTTSTVPLIDLSVELTDKDIAKRQTRLWKLYHFLWDAADKHPEERVFLAKLDLFLISSAMLGYFIKTLNQKNIATAYVNGMDEYYNMEHNQYNTLVTLWTVGYVLGQIPANLILQRVSARYFLGVLELVWAILTICMVECKSIGPLYAIRFLVGLTEAALFPCVQYIIGSWYSPHELAKRESLFACSGVAASMVSGPLQEAVLKGVGKSNHRYKPFQWLFIIDAIISFPIAFYTMFANPNTPSTTNALYLTKREILIAQERRRRIGAQLKTRQKYTLSKIKSFFNTWHIFVFPLMFLAYQNSCAINDQPTFTTWMKVTLKLPSSKYNIYPTAVAGAGIGCTLIVAFISDLTKNKFNYVFVMLYFILQMIGSALLAHWNLPRGLHWFCYFLVGVPTSWGQPQVFSWVNRLLMHDDMKRNFVVVVTNNLAYVTGAWVPNLVWNTKYKPVYHIGFTYNACLASFGFLCAIVAYSFTLRDEKRKEIKNKNALFDEV